LPAILSIVGTTLKEPNTPISPERKALYYAGMALRGVGILLFLSSFLVGLLHFGDFDNFESQARSAGLRALGGIVLMMVGQFVQRVGSRGWAGSGLVLDPTAARKDLSPWSRMGGGILHDVLSEVQDGKEEPSKGDNPPLVKVRCQSCQALNEETARYCNQCGTAI
jgi:hypothetical protein